MTSHNVPFSYTAADVEVVSCLSLSLWEASFILLWEEVTQVSFKFRFPCDFHPQCTEPHRLHYLPFSPSFSHVRDSLHSPQFHNRLRKQAKFNCLIYEVICKNSHWWENTMKRHGAAWKRMRILTCTHPTFLYSNSHVTFVSCLNMLLLWQLKSWWPNVTAIFFPLLLTFTDLLSDRLMFVKALNENSLLCVEKHMIYPPLKLYLFDFLCIEKGFNFKVLKCIWSTKSITFSSVKWQSGMFSYMVSKSVGFCIWEMIVFLSLPCIKRDLQAQSKSYNNKFIITGMWRSSIQAALLKHCRLCVSACFGLGSDSFF